MKLKMNEIVFLERRPFTFADFRQFEVRGEKYEMSHGVFRNNICKLQKAGIVKRAFPSKPAFYTFPGRAFNKKMTLGPMGVPTDIFPQVKETPIYRWIKNRPFKKQSLHNIRLTFAADGIWNTISKVYPDNINAYNQDIVLPSTMFFDYIDVSTTIHHSDTVSVTVACSFRPILIDPKDMFQLFEALTRTEMQIFNIAAQSRSPTVIIPSFRKWIVKLWHFGFDSLDEYDGKEFHVTFQEGMFDLCRIYTKRMEENKTKIRVEKQESPNQAAANAFIQKLFPDGHLINIGIDH
jgi:hypothetical protein